MSATSGTKKYILLKDKRIFPVSDVTRWESRMYNVDRPGLVPSACLVRRKDVQITQNAGVVVMLKQQTLKEREEAMFDDHGCSQI
jgi:hypothetical protein